jgi:hypothetical protein
VLSGDGDARLWLIAEVDYADRFGQPHTGGYGRCLIAGNRYGTRLSFDFVPETEAFNYDRPMHPDKRKHYGKS